MTGLSILAQDKHLLSCFVCLIVESLYVSTMDICAGQKLNNVMMVILPAA